MLTAAQIRSGHVPRRRYGITRQSDGFPRNPPLPLGAIGYRGPLPLRPSRPLTARQRQVLTMIARGDGDKGIAHQLGISPDTVAVHLLAVSRKYGGGSRAALVVKALKCGELKLEDL